MPWNDREFVKLWIGQTASNLGAQTAQLTLPLVALTALGGGAGQLGALRAAQQIPILLCSLVVGRLVDRLRAHHLMVYADLGRAVVLSVVPVAWLLGWLGLPLLYCVAFVLGVLSVFFDVAYQAFLPRLVRREQLAQGNSLLESGRSVTQISGPALGGGLVLAALGPGALLGAVFSARIPRRFGFGRVMILAAVGADVAMVVVPVFTPEPVVLIAVNVVFGALTQLIDVSTTTVRQAITPLDAQGRVVAALNFLGLGLAPVGSLLAGAVAEVLGVREVLLICALGMLLSPLAMVLSPLRRLGTTLPSSDTSGLLSGPMV